KALELYNQALPLLRLMGNKRMEATAINNIGAVYSDLGEKKKALELYNQALSLFRALGNKSSEATILNNIAGIYSDLGEKKKALEYYNQALTFSRALGNRSGEATTLNNIGMTYSDLGEKKKALEFYNQALPLLRAVGERRVEAITLNNIGGIYSDIGEKQKALEHVNQALSLHRAVGYKEGEATSINNLGNLYSDLGEKKKALEFYNQALSLHRAVGDKEGEARTLDNIGGIYLDFGNKQESLKLRNQALSLRRALGDKGGEAGTLNNIATVHLALGENKKALEYFNQALLLLRALGDRDVEATTLNNIGAVYSDLGEKQKALEFLKQALSLDRVVGNKVNEARTLWNLAALDRKQGNLQAARQHIENAIAIIEELRGTYTDQDLKTTYFATVQGYYKFYIDLLMELHKKDPSKGYNALALNTSERSRARGLVELLAQANARLSKNIDPQLIDREQELQTKRQAQEKNLAQLVNQPQVSRETIKQTEAEIQNIINQQKALKAQIRDRNPERDKITNPQPLTLAQIQQQLDKDTVLLQYSLGSDRSFLWLVTSTSLTSYELPKEAEIAKIANRYHTALGDAATTNVAIESAQQLSQLVLAPVKDKLANQLAGKRLVVVADGVLQQIPFAALHDLNGNKGLGNVQNNPTDRQTDGRGVNIKPNPPSPGKTNTNYQPLFLNHEIVNLPSASTIAIQREKTANRQPAPKKIAILADPVYTNDDERVTGKPRSLLGELELERSALDRSAQSLKRTGWSRLPNTATEARGILKLFPPTSSLQAFNFEANYNWATSKDLSQYQILHFATHGFVNPDQPELSGIVLSLLDNSGKQIPGYLRLADLFERDYPAELIVLSACETGLGKNVSGEGLVGLTRGLMYAGAERVALSLWKVNDEGTSVLMQEFYRQMLSNNLTPAQALRAAQRQLWQGSEWRSPHYWAAFTLQGEWR
ncbi:MAG: CHAT domain-containing protein, partial [Methylacidiphilales bacterium]|nr:CHAT domain-containing protein [Candidatus Methylacidiphilales bacterium]